MSKNVMYYTLNYNLGRRKWSKQHIETQKEDRNKVIDEDNLKKKEDEFQTQGRKNGRIQRQVWNQKAQRRVNDNNQFNVLKDQVEDEKEDQKIDNLQDSSTGGKIEEGDQGTPKSRENQSHMPFTASQGSATTNKKEENKEAGIESALVIWNSDMIKEKRYDHLVLTAGEGEILKDSDDDVQGRKVILDLQELSELQKESLQEQK
ncbi:hypothetical protein HAX54_017669 [Datura stramonium]|uniref:Uncharacterized protein n=1 Tax=Datura stramonium TaxID=4076 RepID=A0ABS8Y3F1_DATST|nr:hypothetical protein [Datura stramonium]